MRESVPINAIFRQKKRPRYGNKKVEYEGHKFDSKRECEYYKVLRIMKAAGEIVDFSVHPKYIIIDSYKCPSTGRKIPATTYSADFFVRYPDGTTKVIDVKSEATRKKDAYRIKKKAFEQRYGIAIHEIA